MTPAERSTRWANGIQVGRFVGVPIFIAPSWLASVLIMMYLGAPVVINLVAGMSVLSSYLVSALMGVLLGVSVLAHELGHCVVARSRGVPVLAVRLYLLGGLSEIARLPRTPAEEATIAAAGPAVSGALTAVFAALAAVVEPHTVLWLIFLELAVANGLIAVFNLIPALPLDGGRVLRAGVWRIFGRRRTGTMAGVIGGYLVSFALIVWGVSLIIEGSRTGLLQGAIAIGLGVFVAYGAFSEREVEQRRSGSAVNREQVNLAPVNPEIVWTVNPEIASLVRPCVQVPQSISIAEALRIAAGRDVVLTGEHGNIVGVLDQDRGVSMLVNDAQMGVLAAAEPVGSDQVILFSDTRRELIDVVRATTSQFFLLIGNEGDCVGVFRRIDVLGSSDPPR